MNHDDLLATALQFHAAGISAVPVKTDGSKAPGLTSWKQYQTTAPTLDEILGWFGTGDTDGIGVFPGALSNLEMLEAEGRAVTEGVWDAYLALVDDHGLSEVLQRVMDGYTETTPSGGIHLLYRLADGAPRKNTRLARRPATPAELTDNPGARQQVLLETRGEGGFVVVAPSAGRTHPTQGAWTITRGGIDTIATITVDERDMLFAIASMLDAMPATQAPPKARNVDRAGHIDGERPGDVFNATADWDDIIGVHGWTRHYQMGSGWGWRKPGKTGPGISATTGTSTDGIDRLYVFSTSTEFDPEVPYTKFGAYALLEHGNDYAAAARALAGQGLGTPSRVSDFSDLIGFRDDDPSPTPRDLTDSIVGSFADGMARVSAALSAPDTVPEVFPPSIGNPDGQGVAVATAALDGTQVAHALRLLNQYGHLLRYNVDAERWLVWDGALWREQAPDGGVAYQYAIRAAADMPESTREEAKAKRAAQGAGGLSACLRIAQTYPAVRVRFDDLDSRPWELSTPAGTVNLRTGELMNPLPSHLHTKTTTCTPDWDADRSMLLQFLDTTFQGDGDLIAYVQRLLGYALIGEVREHILPVLFGQGRNGKSVLLDALTGVLGDYADTMPSRFLVVGGEQTSDKAKLIGKRVVVAVETNEGERFNEALAKEITGGDRLTGRLLYRNYVTWTPTHTILFATNHRLEVPSGGTSFWRRLREIPFNHEVPKEEQIEGLGGILAREHGPAVLSWLVDGAVEYGKHGLLEPPAVLAATAEYEQSTDSVGRFVTEEMVVGGGEYVKVRVPELRDAYERFCAESGDHPVSPKALTQALVKRFGIGQARSSTSRYYTNARLAGEGEKGDQGVVDEPKPSAVQEFLS